MSTSNSAGGSRSLYFRGVAWFVLSLVISITNDVFAKYLGQDMHPVQITFLRFFFGTLALLPFMVYCGANAFKTSRVTLHIFRGGLLFGGIALWCFGLSISKIAMATTLNFTIPLFTLILAMFFLKEKVGASRWIATLVGFVGILIVLEPKAENFTPFSLLLLLSAAMFAGLDVINKKYVTKESMLAMLFYTALFTMLIGAYPAYTVWKAPTSNEWVLLAILGCGANLILFCLLKAFSATEASALAPFRYVELVMSAAYGFFLFGEMPSKALIFGALIIIPATFYVVYQDAKKQTEDSGEIEGESKEVAQTEG